MALKQLEGDPTTIRTRAQALKDAATAMGQAAAKLENIESYSGYSSGAVKALGERVGDLRGMVLKAKTRYSGAGTALLTYADALEDAQTKASGAASTHDSLNGSIDTAKYRVDATHVNPLDLNTKPEDVQASKDAVRHLQDLQGQQQAALATYAEAERDRDRAANTAKSAIEEANDKSDLDDSWWDKVSSWVAEKWNSIPWKEVLQAIKDIADIVALITTVAGIILSFTPLAPLGAALIAVGRIASAISFVVGLVQFIRGDIGLKELAIGLLMAATGGLAKLGKLGKLGSLKNLFRSGGLAQLGAGVRNGLKGAGKRLGEKVTNLDPRQVKRDYRTMKDLDDIVKGDKKRVDNFNRMGDDFRNRHQDIGDRRRDVYNANNDAYKEFSREQGTTAAKDFGTGLADGAVENLLNGEVKAGVPGANIEVTADGVSLTGTDTPVPGFGHEPVQIVKFGD